jgi:glycosyltransferase involved in cell wall biosynthesis
MIAGIDNTNDDIIICMDSDLQHPPEKISEMLTVYNEGYDIVLMNRVKRHDNSIFMNFFSKTFYRLFENCLNISLKRMHLIFS